MDVKESVLRKAADQLYWDTRVDASRITLDVKDGEHVILRGTVPDYRMYLAAEEDLLALAGVKSVKNELNVEHQTQTEPLADAEIQSRIEHALNYNPHLKVAGIRASVNNGNVVLEGSVDAYWKKVLAEEVVSGISHVSGLVNKISILPAPDISDATIAGNIIAAISRNKWLDVDAVDVQVENGVVTLAGTVLNWAAHRNALDIARHTPGVIDVIDNLRYQ